jgi:phosphoheptose isomerase
MTNTVIKNNFLESISVKQQSLELLADKIAVAAELMTTALRNGNKILTCGNGGSACDALHFATEMTNRFLKDRQSLPAIALPADVASMTAIANDYDYSEIFAKPLSSLGQPGDILLAISTSGNAKNVCKAIEVAQQKNIKVIALTGKDGGEIAKILKCDDIEICVPSDATPRVQETHILIIHCLCLLIEQSLFA